VARYVATGLDPYADRIGKQTFGFASSRSFTEAMQAVAEVESAFAALPSEIRSEFSNDPAQWLESLGTPDKGSPEIVDPEAVKSASPDPEGSETTKGG